jgi:hypothetical protein
MNCEHLKNEYERYSLGVAAEPAAGEIRAHLARGCAACAEGVRRAALPPSPAAFAPVSRRFGWTPWLAGLALLLFCAAVYFGGRQNQVAGEAARLRTELRTRTIEATRFHEAFAVLSSPDTIEAAFTGGPKGKVHISPGRGVLLIVSNLPPMPPGKVYQMWIVPKSGAPVAAGTFRPETGGGVVHLDRGPVAIAATRAITVTVEDAGGSAQPTAAPLLVAALP